jgi:predicted phage terminase large subunit-like protein
MTTIQPQPGPQMEAAGNPAKILVVGGSAGVGKSWLQVYLAARYHRTPGWDAILFRRTQPMLEGGGSLWAESEKLYPLFKGIPTTRPLTWTWPNVPSRVEMRHMQHEKSAGEHKSKQYAYIGLDEATDFTGGQFNMLSSRLRSMSGVRTQMVLTCNPDPDSYLREWLDWWIADDGFPDPGKAGRIRYYVRVSDEVVWADSPDALVKYVDDPRHVMSMSFIPGTIYNNKILLEKDPSYLGNLKALPRVERERFLGGNWDAKEAAGDYFQSTLFKRWYDSELEKRLMDQDGHPAKIVQSIRCWDTASTPVKGDLVPDIGRNEDFKAREKGSSDPDWTCSVRLDRTANGRIIVADATFHRDSPGAIEAFMERMAIHDGPSTVVGIRTDPGQAGVAQTERLQSRIRKHSRCAIIEQTQAKEQYAREPSRAVHRGEVYYREGPWNRQFWNHLESFPTKGAKDDAVDALSGGYLWLQENPAPFYSYESADRPRVVDQALRDFHTSPLKGESATIGVKVFDMGRGSRGWGLRNW